MNNNPINIIEVLSLLRSGWKTIFFSTLITTLLTISYLSFVAKEEWTTEVLWLSSQKNSNKLAGLAALAGVNLDVSNSKEPIYSEIIFSEMFLKYFHNNEWKTKNSTSPKPLNEILNLKLSDFHSPVSYIEPSQLYQKTLSQFIKGSLKYNNLGSSHSIKVTTFDPVLSHEIANSFIKHIKLYLEKDEETNSYEERSFIETRLNEFKTELYKAEGALTQFEEKNIQISSPSLKLRKKRLEREVAVNNQLVIEFRKQFELAKIKELKKTSRFKTIKSPEIPLYASKPNKKAITVTSLIIGFSIGCLLVLILDFFKDFKIEYSKQLKKLRFKNETK